MPAQMAGVMIRDLKVKPVEDGLKIGSVLK
jgi:uncharacterized Zn ribbon protein